MQNEDQKTDKKITNRTKTEKMMDENEDKTP